MATRTFPSSLSPGDEAASFSNSKVGWTKQIVLLKTPQTSCRLLFIPANSGTQTLVSWPAVKGVL